jgi:Ras family
VIVCDMQASSSFDNVEHWIAQIHANADIKSPTVMVLANKRDIDKKQVTN